MYMYLRIHTVLINLYILTYRYIVSVNGVILVFQAYSQFK